MILTILTTFWITCGIIRVSEQRAKPFKDALILLLEFVFAPILIFLDTIALWEENKEMRLKYKK